LSSRVVRDRPMKNMAMEMTWVMASPCDERASSVSLAGAWLVGYDGRVTGATPGGAAGCAHGLERFERSSGKRTTWLRDRGAVAQETLGMWVVPDSRGRGRRRT